MLRSASRRSAVQGSGRPSRHLAPRSLLLPLLFLVLLAAPGSTAASVETAPEKAVAENAVAGEAVPEPASRTGDDGTRRMAERLAKLQAEREAGSGWDAVLALEALEGQPLPDDPRARVAREVEVAMWTLLAGDAAAAVERFERLAASPAAAGLAAAAAHGSRSSRPGSSGPGSSGRSETQRSPCRASSMTPCSPCPARTPATTAS